MMLGQNSSIVTFGGGCFWCLEAAFGQLRGVVSAEPGYCGGSTENPTYRAVCDGDTGHAEVVRVVFDPTQVSFETLLEVFFSIHDPTTLNRQGQDIGTQYRSVIFCHSPEQQAAAEKVVALLNDENVWEAPLVTEVVAAQPFYPAEGYHRRYYERNSEQAYCQVVIAPKLAKLRQRFRERLSMNMG